MKNVKKFSTENPKTCTLLSLATIASTSIMIISIIQGIKSDKIFKENGCKMVPVTNPEVAVPGTRTFEGSSMACPVTPEICNTSCGNIGDENDLALLCGLIDVICISIPLLKESAKKVVTKISEMSFLGNKAEKKPLAEQLKNRYGTGEPKDIESANKFINK